MTKSSINLQDSFLNQVRKENTEITMVLLDGTRLNGHVRGFDNFTVVVHEHGNQHLIYKHAIAHIIQKKPTNQAPSTRDQDAAPRGAGAPRPAAESDGSGSTTHHPPKQHRDRTPREPREGAKSSPPADKFNTIDLTNLKSE